MTGVNRAVRAASPNKGNGDIDWSEGQTTTRRGYQHARGPGDDKGWDTDKSEDLAAEEEGYRQIRRSGGKKGWGIDKSEDLTTK